MIAQCQGFVDDSDSEQGSDVSWELRFRYCMPYLHLYMWQLITSFASNVTITIKCLLIYSDIIIVSFGAFHLRLICGQCRGVFATCKLRFDHKIRKAELHRLDIDVKTQPM